MIINTPLKPLHRVYGYFGRLMKSSHGFQTFLVLLLWLLWQYQLIQLYLDVYNQWNNVDLFSSFLK